MKKWFKRIPAALVSIGIAVGTAAPVSAGWQKIDGRWKYQTGSSYVSGWQYLDQNWYYFDGQGMMQTGWLWKPEGWYYLCGDGRMATGWQMADGKWYYFAPGGLMQKGWQYLGGKWYYLSGSGAMETGWLTLNGKRYYLNQSGAMVTGEQVIDGENYRFGADGALQEEQVDSAAEWLELVNQYRREAGVSELASSVSLNQAAEIRASEIAQVFSHTRPDGREWYSVLAEVGQENVAAAENIALNYPTAAAALKGWMNSEGHRTNLLNPDYRYLGMACTQNSSGQLVWVQLFTDRLN